MAFATLTAKLNLNIADFASKLTSASKQMSKFASTLNSTYATSNAALKSHNLGLKDTARIVQGILVSQAFYRVANAIQEATRSLWDFNKSLDYAQVTYSALFGDATLARNFMSALQEHSINTIFDYQQLTDASKKLLAYGVEYKNLMFIMEGLTNLGAMSGDAAALDRISLALGQIYTRGKLTAEEMRQLANAYVPIADIIQSKFNLTPDEMGKVGDLNLPAGEVINAVVDYANERFASVGDAAMYTITGLQNKIVDTLKVMGSEMMAPLTTAYKSFLAYVSNGLTKMRDAFASGGSKGLFEYLVPDANTQQMIRQFIANVRNLLMSLISVGTVVGQVFGNFAYVLVSAFNIVSPVITWFTNALAAALNAMLNTRTGAVALRIALLGAAAAFVVIRAHAVGALVITAVTNAVMGLAKALIILASLVTRHPILMLLAGLAIALVGVSVASNNADSGLNNLFDTISEAAGGGSGDILNDTTSSIEDAADAADDFSERFEEGAGAAADALEGVGGAADKARKKVGLLSFDEVFRLNEPAGGGGGGGGIADDIDSLLGDLGGLGGGIGDSLIPDIPDFSEFIKGFTDGLFGGLMDSLVGKLATFGLGAWFAGKLAEALGKFPVTGLAATGQKIAMAVMRAISGAFIGLAFDALVSPLMKKLWQALEDALRLDDGSAEQAALGATIGSAIGGAIGMLVGGLPGSLIGAAIGQLAGGIVGLLWDEIDEALSNSIVGLGSGIASAIAKAFGGSFSQVVGLIDFTSLSSIFSGIGQVFSTTGLKAIAKGGIIGLAIGFVVDGIAALLWNTLIDRFGLEENAKETAKVGQTIGSLIGTVIGGLLGGPAGALIGSAIGTFAGGLVGLFWDQVVAFFSNPNVGIGMSIGATIGTFFGPVGTVIGTVVGAVLGHFWEDISAGFSKWWGDISAGFSEWWSGIYTGFSEWCANIDETVLTWWDGVKTSWQTKWDNITKGLSTWWSETKEKWSKKYEEIKTELSTWWGNVKTTYNKKKDEILSNLSTWWSDTKDEWSKKYEEIKTELSTWWGDVKDTYNKKKDEIFEDLSTWWSETRDEWSKKYGEIKTDLSTWWGDVKTTYNKKKDEIFGDLSTWWDDTKKTWSNRYQDIKTDLGLWWEDTRDTYNKKKDEIFGDLSTWWDDTKKTWSNKYQDIKTDLGLWWEGIKTDYGTNSDGLLSKASEKLDEIKKKWSEKWEEVKTDFGTWWSGMKTSMDTWLEDNIWKPISNFFNLTNFWNRIRGLLDAIKRKVSIWWSGVSSIFSDSPSVGSTSGGGSGGSLGGHAAGGIFNREHIARFAEGNKAEAVIPLENASAMQPFVDAISRGIVEGIAPVMVQRTSETNYNTGMPPMYVGTLIADEQGLKQLYRKLEVIQVQENARRGLA